MKNTIIILKTPIKRGEKEITEIEIREPKAGELRGIKLLDVVQMDATAYAELLPRISQPVLTKDEFNQLSMSDFAQVTTCIAQFFEGKPSASE